LKSPTCSWVFQVYKIVNSANIVKTIAWKPPIPVFTELSRTFV